MIPSSQVSTKAENQKWGLLILTLTTNEPPNPGYCTLRYLLDVLPAVYAVCLLRVSNSSIITLSPPTNKSHHESPPYKDKRGLSH